VATDSSEGSNGIGGTLGFYDTAPPSISNLLVWVCGETVGSLGDPGSGNNGISPRVSVSRKNHNLTVFLLSKQTFAFHGLGRIERRIRSLVGGRHYGTRNRNANDRKGDVPPGSHKFEKPTLSSRLGWVGAHAKRRRWVYQVIFSLKHTQVWLMDKRRAVMASKFSHTQST